MHRFLGWLPKGDLAARDFQALFPTLAQASKRRADMCRTPQAGVS